MKLPVWVLLVTTAGACATTSSTTGTLVTDVRVDGTGLVVETCQLAYEVTAQSGLFWQSDRRASMEAYGCEGERQALPPGIDPTPAPPAAQATGPIASLTARARVSAAAGDCRAVRRLGAKVASIAPDYYATTFATDASLAPCLGGVQ